MRQIGEVSTNRLLDVWEALLSFGKYFLSNTFSQNIDNCSVAFSLCSVYLQLVYGKISDGAKFILTSLYG